MPAASKLQGKAGIVHERLQVLDRLTKESVQLLNVLDSSLTHLSEVTAPIHSRATALTAAQHNIAGTKEAVDKLLEHLDTSRRVQPILEAGPVRDLDGFLDSLTQLEASNDFLVQHGQLAAVQAAIEHSQSVFNKALESCDSDFRVSMSAGSRGTMPDAAWLASARQALAEGSSHDAPHQLVRDLLPSSLLPKLRRMVELMLQAEYVPAQEGYISCRSRALHQVFAEARLELPASSRPGLLPPEQLDKFMGSWGQQLSSLTLLLLSEQKLAEDIWPSPLNRQLFGQLTQPFLASLVAAGHDIVEARKTPDKLFPLLDMHAQISLSLPLLSKMLTPPQQQARHSSSNSRRTSAAGGGNTSPHAPPHGSSSASGAGAFSSAAGAFSAAGAALIDSLWELQQLVASAALGLFGEYEDLVARDGASKVLPADGTIHPLTAQVLSYIKRLLGHPHVADILYGRAPHPGRTLLRSPADDDDEDDYDFYNDPQVVAANEGRLRPLSRAEAGLSAGVARLLIKLLDNLELKSRAYKNDALAALFIMNNVHYVQWSVENSPAALDLLGVAWLERHKDVVEEWGAAYHDATWMPLVHMLRSDPPADPVRMKQALKDTYNSFNSTIESIYTSQSGWTIPDHALRAAVKRVIKDDLIDTYQDFLRRHADVPFTQTPAKYIRYAASDVASIIDDDLFETKAVSMNKLSLQKEKLGAIV